MFETIMAIFAGGFLRKICKMFDKKSDIEEVINKGENTPTNQDNNPAEYQSNTTDSKTPEIWQSNSWWANLGNFIVITTRSFITYLFFWFMVFIVGYVILKKDSITEQELSIFNIILTYIIPSIIGYWFISIPFMGGGINGIITKITKYIKK